MKNKIIYTFIATTCIIISAFATNINDRITNYETLLNCKDNFTQTPPNKTSHTYIPQGKTIEEQLLLKRIAAYDVGSSGVKFLLADVDLEKKKIVNVLLKKTIDTPLEINETNYNKRIAIMLALKTLVEEYYPHFHKIEHYAIATAGFRRAGNLGKKLANEIRDVTNIDFNIIEQNDEAQLAQNGVFITTPEYIEKEDIIWDIGGGSTQIIYENKESNNYSQKALGVKVGALVLRDEVMYNIKGTNRHPNIITDNLSPLPLTIDEIEKVSILAKSFMFDPTAKTLPLTPQDVNALKKKIKAGGKLYGVGAIHQFVVGIYTDTERNQKPQNYYTLDELNNVIQKIANKSAEYINKNLKNNQQAELKFTATTDIPILILVREVMTYLGINKIYPIKINNTEGLILQIIQEKKGKSISDIKSDATKIKQLIQNKKMKLPIIKT